MAQKTKAAMRGRQCSTEIKEQKQDTRPAAGGQSLTAPVITGTAPLARLRGKLAHKVNNFYPVLRVTKSHAHLNTTLKLGCLGCTALQHTPYLSRGVGCEPVAHTLLLQTSLGVVQTSPLRSPVLVSSNIGCGTYTKKVGHSKGFQFCTKSAKPCYPEVGHYSLSDSFAFLRCRRLISPWTAALINWPVLSPGSLSCSIPSISSWAILAVTDCDFEFFGPVAISTLHCNWCKTIYTKFWGLKVLTCKTPLIYLVSYTLLCSGAETAKPGSGGTLTGPLTKPLSEVTTMAELQSTQTRPEFTWRFLALSAIGRNVIHITATTEREAREQSPDGCVMVFAGRLPVPEVSHG